MRANLKEHRQHKIFSDYGVKDYYAYYLSKGGTYDKATFNKVLRIFNKGLYPIICSFNYDYKLPKRMGVLQVIQNEAYVVLDNEGNIKTNRPVNFKATLDMWEKDPESKEKKLVVRHENQYVFSVNYYKKLANYKNKSLYHIHVNRALKQYLTAQVKSNPTFKAQIKWKPNLSLLK
jgi:hypothetical protein